MTQDTIRRIVRGDGVLFALNQASVMPKIAAPVQRFLVQRGDHVKQGQLLAVLEIPELQDDMATDEAAVNRSSQEVKRAEADLTLLPFRPPYLP